MTRALDSIRRASPATLLARGRDSRATIRVFSTSFMQTRIFELTRRSRAAPIPPLYGEGGAAIAAPGGVLRRKGAV